VNGQRVDIPSYLVKAGDVIGIREKIQQSPRMKELLENAQSRTVPAWLQLDANVPNGQVVRLPAREEIDTPVTEQMIVEYYSR
jgi:small subunit ribosomal protein S4